MNLSTQGYSAHITKLAHYTWDQAKDAAGRAHTVIKVLVTPTTLNVPIVLTALPSLSQIARGLKYASPLTHPVVILNSHFEPAFEALKDLSTPFSKLDGLIKSAKKASIALWRHECSREIRLVTHLSKLQLGASNSLKSVRNLTGYKNSLGHNQNELCITQIQEQVVEAGAELKIQAGFSFAVSGAEYLKCVSVAAKRLTECEAVHLKDRTIEWIGTYSKGLSHACSVISAFSLVAHFVLHDKRAWEESDSEAQDIQYRQALVRVAALLSSLAMQFFTMHLAVQGMLNLALVACDYYMIKTREASIPQRHLHVTSATS